jgi:hypothetical protein
MAHSKMLTNSALNLRVNVCRVLLIELMPDLQSRRLGRSLRRFESASGHQIC